MEDQSLVAKDQGGEGGAHTAGLGVAPKGRCVSGRDWKARNQSQRCDTRGVGGSETRYLRFVAVNTIEILKY